MCKAGSGYPQDGEGLQAALASAENALGESLTATHGNGQLHKYPSPDEVATGSRQEEQTWPCPSPVKQMAAWDAGWVVLYEDGSVATMGDGRFEDCLGREVTSDT